MSAQKTSPPTGPDQAGPADPDEVVSRSARGAAATSLVALLARGVGLAALGPAIAGTGVMAAALWGLKAGLSWLQAAPLPALLAELAAGGAVYAAYLRLCHREVFRTAMKWVRAQVA